MRLGVVAVVLCWSSLAFADEPEEPAPEALNAKLTCKSAGHVTCTIGLGELSADGLTAQMSLTQDGKDSASHAGMATETGFKFDPFMRGVEVRSCKPYTVHARVLQGDEVAWSVDQDVTPRCKKPKKVTAKLSCTFIAADGTVYGWPGTGAKTRPKLDDTIACWIKGGKAGLTGIIAGRAEELFQDDDDKKWSSAQMLEADLDFTPCEPFTVSASIENADGQVVWTGKVAFAQKC